MSPCLPKGEEMMRVRRRWLEIGLVFSCALVLLLHIVPGTASAQTPEMKPRGARSAPGGSSADELFELPAHAVARLGGSRFSFPHVVNTVALSPDGKHMAAGGLSPDVCVWDLATGRMLWRSHIDEVQVG